jgi:hypothetical protein
MSITSSNNTHTLAWAGTLSMAKGGSGANITGAAGGIVYSSTTTAMAVLAAGTSGQILLSGGSGTPAWSLATIDGSGNVTGNAFFYSSDRRLKYDIKDVKGLELILAMRGVSFKWKRDNSPELGLIAQEVEKVAPELVKTDLRTGLKAVKYGNLVAPLIESVKELYGVCTDNSERIDTAERKISSIETANADRDSRVQNLEKSVQNLTEENAKLKSEIEEIKQLLKSK